MSTYQLCDVSPGRIFYAVTASFGTFDVFVHLDDGNTTVLGSKIDTLLAAKNLPAAKLMAAKCERLALELEDRGCVVATKAPEIVPAPVKVKRARKPIGVFDSPLALSSGIPNVAGWTDEGGTYSFGTYRVFRAEAKGYRGWAWCDGSNEAQLTKAGTPAKRPDCAVFSLQLAKSAQPSV